MKNPLRYLIPVTVLMLGGCAVSTDDSVMTSPPIGTDSRTETTRSETDLPTTVAILPFTNTTQSQFAYEVVRRTMANHFSTKNYRWLHWKDVDSRLVLAGLDSADKVNALGQDEVARILGVDGLIYGDITHYNKTFAGIYAQISVGVQLKFVNSEGRVLWEVKDVQRSHAGGVSTSPVGLLMNALVAAKHLYGDLNLYRAADDLGRDLAQQIPEPKSLSQRSRPAILNVVHSGVGQYLNYGDTLEIGLEGDAGMTAVASIDGIGLVDLAETSPGQYVGSVSIDRSLNLDGVVVTGRLQDDFGQTTSWISPYGLLNVDNTAPGPVMNLAAESRDGTVSLTWDAPSADDIAGYQVMLAMTETGGPSASFNAPNSEFLLTDLANFETVYVTVVAIDRAENSGTGARLSTAAAPDARFGDAMNMPSALPPVISGTYRMMAGNGPYSLRTDTRIATDGVVLVGPGVVIEVSPRAKLTVMGDLQVFGTGASPVVARGADGQDFAEFIALQTTTPVRIIGLTVDGGGIPLQIRAGAPLIEDCNLLNSQFNAMTIGGSARPTIRNCTISGAGASGVIIEGQSQPVFSGNRFLDNDPFHIQNGSTYQVDVMENSFEPAASNMTVLGDVRYQ